MTQKSNDHAVVAFFSGRKQNAVPVLPMGTAVLILQACGAARLRGY